MLILARHQKKAPPPSLFAASSHRLKDHMAVLTSVAGVTEKKKKATKYVTHYSQTKGTRYRPASSSTAPPRDLRSGHLLDGFMATQPAAEKGCRPLH